MAVKKLKPPLKNLTEHLFDIHRAVSDVAGVSARMLGAVKAHCEMLATVCPQAADNLLRAVERIYNEGYDAHMRLIRL
jgi:hypothetical protein